MWILFLNHYNGITLIHPKANMSSTEHHLHTDSSILGYGATFGRDFVYGVFPPKWQDFSIQVLELYPIFLILHLFAEQLKHKHVTFHSDNLAIVQIINKQTSRCKHIMKLLRPMILTMLKYNISFKAVHIPGKFNNLCDALSRLQINKDLLKYYGMNALPKHVPLHLRPANLKMI